MKVVPGALVYSAQKAIGNRINVYFVISVIDRECKLMQLQASMENVLRGPFPTVIDIRTMIINEAVISKTYLMVLP